MIVPFSFGTSLSFAILTSGVVFAAVSPSTGTSTVSFESSGYVTSTLTTSFPVLFAPPFPLWSVPCTTFPPSTNSFVACGWSFGTSGNFTASLTFCTSASFVIVPFSFGTSLSFAVLTSGVVFAAVSPSTGTSTTSSLPSLYVTLTLTTSLSVLSAPPSAL